MPESTDLQVHCHDFARGQAAVALSLDLLEGAVAKLGEELRGTYPDQPHVTMRNAKLPLYGLAYSGFVDKLELDTSGVRPKLEVKLTATIHPDGKPDEVISTYEVTLPQPVDVEFAYVLAGRELRWAPRSSPLANVAPAFSPDAERILRGLRVPEPVLDTYERKVESVIIWNTSNTFVQLVINSLPPVEIGQIAPWLTLLDPIRVDFGQRYAVITSDKVRMSIGDCTPIDVIQEPDPNFPYGMARPTGRRQSNTGVAIYLPKSRLVEFVAKNVMPAVMYDTGQRGGIIKWRMSGAFGLKEFTLDISGDIQIGTPGNLTLRGTLAASTEIALTGVARAWVNGPCGSQIGLANASIQGDGEFAADILLTYRSSAAVGAPQHGSTLEATLAVTRAQLDPNVDIDMVGWPIDDIVGELADYLVNKEISKMTGSIHKVGKWEMVGLPDWLAEMFGSRLRPKPVIESLAGVSSVIGISVHGD